MPILNQRTSYQKINNVNYFRNAVFRDISTTAVRGDCPNSRKLLSGDDLIESGKESDRLFVQESVKLPEAG